MAETMGPRNDSRQHRPRRTVRADSSLGRYVAQGGSRSLAGAHAKEIRTWSTARHLIACYAMPRALRAIESLRACIVGLIRPVDNKRVREANAKDQAEDTAEMAWLLDPCPATREALVRAKYEAIAADAELARDLDAEGRRVA